MALGDIAKLYFYGADADVSFLSLGSTSWPFTNCASGGISVSGVTLDA